MFNHFSDYAALIIVLISMTIIAVWLRKYQYFGRRLLIHLRLQKYAGPNSNLAVQRRKEAARIIAISETAAIEGYRIVQSIGETAVDGFHREDDAIEGLKAAAAMKGANAIIKLYLSNSHGGKYIARGEAVIVEPDRSLTDKLYAESG